MMAKVCWRIINVPNSLAGQILKAKYFPSTEFLEAEGNNGSSYLWQSICWGRELLSKGVRWRVGNGERIRLFRDPWLRRPITLDRSPSPLMKELESATCRDVGH